MSQQFAVVAGQVGTLFLMMGVGFVMGKVRWLSRTGVGDMSTILLYIVTPCIAINVLQIDYTPELLGRIGLCALVMGISYGICILFSFFLFRRQEANRRVVLQMGSVYGNVGFMGIPLVQSVFGQEGLIYCVVGVVLFNILIWVHGATIMGGKVVPRRIFLNPGTVGMVVGMALFVTSTRLPGPALKAVGYLADLNTPLAMLVIGAQMSWADLKTTLRQYTLYASSAIKLLAIPAVTALALLPIGLDPILYGVCVLLAATPTAGATSIFAQKFERDTAAAAQLVTLSTLLSAFSLPVFVLIAQNIG